MVRDIDFNDYVTARGLTDRLKIGYLDGCEDAVGIFRLNKGWIQSPLFIPITEDGYTSLNFSRVYSQDKYDFLYTPGFADTLSTATQQTLSDSFIIGGSRNHFHLLMDFLPRLYCLSLSPELRGMRFVIDAEMMASQQLIVRSLLNNFGISTPQLIPVDPGIYRIENSFVVSRLSRSLATRIWTTHLCPIDHTKTRGPERLFVIRDGVTKRRLINQNQIASHLRTVGFECVDPAKLAFEDQIHLFSNARLIIGAHGAALTNILFAPPGATLIELYVEPLQPHYRRLAAQKKIFYLPIPGKRDAKGAGGQHDDFTIDLNALSEILRLFEKSRV